MSTNAASKNVYNNQNFFGSRHKQRIRLVKNFGKFSRFTLALMN